MINCDKTRCWRCCYHLPHNVQPRLLTQPQCRGKHKRLSLSEEWENVYTELTRSYKDGHCLREESEPGFGSVLCFFLQAWAAVTCVPGPPGWGSQSTQPAMVWTNLGRIQLWPILVYFWTALVPGNDANDNRCPYQLENRSPLAKDSGDMLAALLRMGPG